jgi:hypothetical protein
MNPPPLINADEPGQSQTSNAPGDTQEADAEPDEAQNHATRAAEESWEYTAVGADPENCFDVGGGVGKAKNGRLLEGETYDEDPR